MERRFVTLQWMFDDAHEIEENFHGCQKLPKQILDKNVGAQKDDEVCVEEQVVDPTFFDGLPIFDVYNDYFLELPNLFVSSEGDSFQKSNDSIHPMCHNYNMI